MPRFSGNSLVLPLLVGLVFIQCAALLSVSNSSLIYGLLGLCLVLTFFCLFIVIRQKHYFEAVLQTFGEALRAYRRGFYDRRISKQVIPRLITSPELNDLRESVNSLGEEMSAQVRDLRGKYIQQLLSLESMQHGVLVIDGEYRVKSSNVAGARILKEDRSLLVGADIRSFGEAGACIAQAVASGNIVQLPLFRAPEPERWIEARVTELNGEGGNRERETLVEVSDITEIKRFERARQDFVANVSHELKTPITSIQGYLETLLDGGEHTAEDKERFLQILSTQASRLSSIVAELLALARLESGEDLDPESLLDTTVSDLLQSAQESCAMAAGKRNVEIILDCEPQIRWRMNRWLMEQAVINLIDNAIKYGNAGGQVRVLARREGRNLLIHVLDESPGIPPEHLPRLFERFYRIDKARSRRSGGSGLGLSIVKHIMAAHKGKVTVESEPGKGSTFTLIVPE